MEPRTPPVILWYRIYCGILAAFWGLYLFLGLFLLAFPSLLPGGQRGMPPGVDMILRIEGLVLVAIGAIAAGLYLASYLLPRHPWAWVVHLVLICLSLTNCLCLPLGVPLVVYWTDAETRAWFGFRP